MIETTTQGLYLAPPHGELIAQGTKTAIAKARPMGLEGEWVLLSGGHAYGHMRVGQPEALDVEDFKARRDEHGVSEKERLRWWPERSPLYLYPVEGFRPFAQGPVTVELPPGVQTRVDIKGMGLEVGQKAKRAARGRWRTLRDGRRVLVTTGARVSKRVRGAMATWSEQILKDGLADGNEHGVFLDNQGTRMGTTIDGAEDSIDTSDFEWKGEQHVFVHNHPSGNSFSGPDIGTFMSHPEVEHMIAVGHDGSMHRITKRELPHRTSALAELGRKQYGDRHPYPEDSPLTKTQYWVNLGSQYIHRVEMNKLYSEYLNKVWRKEMTPEAASREHTHRAMIQAARKLGLEYQKVYLSGY